MPDEIKEIQKMKENINNQTILANENEHSHRIFDPKLWERVVDFETYKRIKRKHEQK